MRRFRHACLAASCALIPVCSTVAAAPPAADALIVQVDALFASLTPADPGCSVGVSRAGQPLLLKAYGQSDLENLQPNGVDTVFEAGSVSKQFTAAAVYLLARQGRLSLDDELHRYLPELPAYGAPITLRQLLNHSSGIRNWDDLAEIGGRSRGSQVASQDFVLGLLSRQRSLNFTPGSQYLYSNSNYVLAAIVVERVSGLSFAEFSRRFIFEPLGMRATRWRDDYTEIVPGRAQAYSKPDDRIWHLDMPFENVVGAGGLLTTILDLLRWNANFEQGTVGGEGFAEAMQQGGVLNSGRRIAYALGLELSNEHGHAVISHAGATTGYRAYLARVPDQALSVALLCNAGSLNTEDLGPELLALFLPSSAPDVVPPASTVVTLTASQLQAVAGLYRNTRTDAAAQIDVDGGSLRLDGGSRFAPVSASLFQSVRGTRLVPDARGFRLLKLDGDEIAFERVPAWKPGPAALRAFAGSYVSDEADSKISVVVTAQGLELHGPMARPFRMQATYRDGFEDPDSSWRLHFTRDRRGRPDGFALSRTRTRNLRFVRTRD